MHDSRSSHSPSVEGDSACDFELGGFSKQRKYGIHRPGCREEMEFCELQSSQFAGCPSCNALLFQQPVFAKLTLHLRTKAALPKLVPAPMDSAQLTIERSCPTCGARLETHAFCGPGNAVIDTCFPCGVIFLDAGELSKLVSAPGK